MARMFYARNLIFYPGEISDNNHELSDEILVPYDLLGSLIDMFNNDEPLLVRIKNMDTGLSYVVAFSASHRYDKKIIYMPNWILDIIGHDGITNSLVSITKVTEDIPIATKIVIKPLDPRPFEYGIIDCFEKAMMNLHSVQEGITIPITLFDDTQIFAYIQTVEPAPLARIVNGEVVVDFINDFIVPPVAGVPEPSAPLAPPLVQPSAPLAEPMAEPMADMADMVEPSAPPAPPVELSIEERRRQVRESYLKRFKPFPTSS